MDLKLSCRRDGTSSSRRQESFPYSLTGLEQAFAAGEVKVEDFEKCSCTEMAHHQIPREGRWNPFDLQPVTQPWLPRDADGALHRESFSAVQRGEACQGGVGVPENPNAHFSNDGIDLVETPY